MKGRYPVCCLFLEIDPAAVDVNIHPAKREVKFHREFEIRKLVGAGGQAKPCWHSMPNRKPRFNRQDAKRAKPNSNNRKPAQRRRCQTSPKN